MRFKSAIDLKAELLKQEHGTVYQREIMIGLVRAETGYKVAVRVRALTLTAELAEIIEVIACETQGEFDLKIVGEIDRQLKPRKVIPAKSRALSPGASISHYRGSGGTLGCFAVRRSDGALGFLSSSLVMTEGGIALEGDEIVSPGVVDGGAPPRDVVGHLGGRYPSLSPMQKAHVDCAFATLNKDCVFDPLLIGESDQLSKEISVLPYPDVVYKVGRSGRTQGRISAFDLTRNIEYPFGRVRFDGLIEIAPLGIDRFADAGDSGSLVFTSERQPLGLLIASTNDGVAYACPISAVTKALGVDLV